MFSATIPDKIYFKFKKPKFLKKDKILVLNNWIFLPDGHPNQIKTPKGAKQHLQAELFASDKHKIDIYANNQEYISHENKPIKLKLAGFSLFNWPYDYKSNLIVSTMEGIHFSIGNDVFVNAVISDGLKPGGELPGEYIFIRLGKTITPIKINSSFYKAVIDFQKEKSKEKIKIKNMQVGEVYSTASGNVALFLGFVNTQSMIVDTEQEIEKYFYGKIHKCNNPVKPFGVRFKKKKLLSLWMELGNVNNGYQKTTCEINKDLFEILKSKKHYYFSVREKYSFNNKFIENKVEVPTNIIIKVRNLINEKVPKIIEQERIYRVKASNIPNYFATSNGKNTIKLDTIRHFDAHRVAEYSSLLNMVPYGMESIMSDICKIFEPWFQTENIFKK